MHSRFGNLTIGPPDGPDDTSLQRLAHPPHRAAGLRVGEERNAAMALLATTIGLLTMVEEEKMRSMKFLSLFSIALMFVSCGHYPKRIGPMGPDHKRLTWNAMSKPQREAHMRKEVLPRAAALFGTWRPDRFARVDCTLCHGASAYTGNFKMPTTHLPRLSGDVFLGPEFAKYPETTRLKLDRLVPTMSEALGLKSFNLLTRRGFGCYSCHLGPSGQMFGN